MAELGLVASLAGIVSLGLTVCKGLTEYYNTYRNAEDDVRSLCDEANSLTQTLQVSLIAWCSSLVSSQFKDLNNYTLSRVHLTPVFLLLFILNQGLFHPASMEPR